MRYQTTKDKLKENILAIENGSYSSTFELGEEQIADIQGDYEIPKNTISYVCNKLNSVGYCRNEEEFYDIVCEAICAKNSEKEIKEKDENYVVRNYDEIIADVIVAREGELPNCYISRRFYK